MSGGIPNDAKPRLMRGVRLREDPQRGWLLLAPETVFELNLSSAEILKLCDGTRTFGDIVDTLSVRFATAPERVAGDAAGLISRLRDLRLIE